MPTAEQIVYVSSRVSAALLENAADEGHDEALIRAIRAWFPDRSAVDDHEIKRIARTVRANLMTHRALLLDRLDRLVSAGKAEPL